MAHAPTDFAPHGFGCSGVRRATSAVGMLAAGAGRRADSRSMRRRPFVLVVDDREADLEVIARALQDRFEIRFASSLAAAEREIAHAIPDALLVDEDVDQDVGALLERLAGDIRSPVVIVLSSSDEHPSLAQIFGVPFVQRPLDAERLVAALDVARDQQLRPVGRRFP